MIDVTFVDDEAVIMTDRGAEVLHSPLKRVVQAFASTFVCDPNVLARSSLSINTANLCSSATLQVDQHTQAIHAGRLRTGRTLMDKLLFSATTASSAT